MQLLNLLAAEDQAAGAPATTCSGAAADLHLTTLTALLQAQASGYSREYVRVQVLGWASQKWPELFVGHSTCEPNFEAHTPYAQVKVSTSCAGRYVWAFTGRHPDMRSDREWETRVLMLGDPDHDTLVVRNGHFGGVDFTSSVAQPRFLKALVGHLDFDDGGLRVRTVPHGVPHQAAFENMVDHLLSERRTLPILAIGSSAGVETPNRAIDAWSLAGSVCGLAHVVSFTRAVSDLLEHRLGTAMGVRPGEARLFMPGAGKGRDPESHPRFLPEEHAWDDVDSVGAAVCNAAYDWSVSEPRRRGFDAIWASAAQS